MCLSKYVVDFIVPRNRLLLTCGGIEINVVPSAVPYQNAALPK